MRLRQPVSGQNLFPVFIEQRRRSRTSPSESLYGVAQRFACGYQCGRFRDGLQLCQHSCFLASRRVVQECVKKSGIQGSSGLGSEAWIPASKYLVQLVIQHFCSRL